MPGRTIQSVTLTRRDWLASAGLFLSSACARRKGAGYDGYALIATEGDNSAAVVDLTAFRLLRPIALNAPPSAVISGGPAGRSYVLTGSNGSVHVITHELQRATSKRLADQLSALRLTPDRKRLLAISAQSRELIQADASSLQVTSRYKLDAEPSDMDVSSTRFAAASSGEYGAVELFDLQTGGRWRKQLQRKTGAVRFRADGEILLVANLQERSLTALAVPSLDVIADLTLAMQPENLCFNADQGQLFISGQGMDGVAIVFPYGVLEVEQTVLAGRSPGVMACSAVPAYLFVASNSSSDVFILDINTRKVIAIVDAGQEPTYLAVTPGNEYALVLDRNAGTLAVIHIGAIRVNFKSVSNRSGAALFTLLPVGSRPVDAAVVPRM